jgi:AraC-like DNA-binding protein
LGISQCYLEGLLQETGKSFTEHVNELRLERASALFIAADSNRRVSKKTFEVGFSDLPHLYNLVRSRFGDIPKGVSAALRRRGPTKRLQQLDPILAVVAFSRTRFCRLNARYTKNSNKGPSRLDGTPRR